MWYKSNETTNLQLDHQAWSTDVIRQTREHGMQYTRIRLGASEGHMRFKCHSCHDWLMVNWILTYNIEYWSISDIFQVTKIKFQSIFVINFSTVRSWSISDTFQATRFGLNFEPELHSFLLFNFRIRRSWLTFDTYHITKFGRSFTYSTKIGLISVGQFEFQNKKILIDFWHFKKTIFRQLHSIVIKITRFGLNFAIYKKNWIDICSFSKQGDLDRFPTF